MPQEMLASICHECGLMNAYSLPACICWAPCLGVRRLSVIVRPLDVDAGSIYLGVRFVDGKPLRHTLNFERQIRHGTCMCVCYIVR